MELIILGLKNKTTGAYKVYNVNGRYSDNSEMPVHPDVKLGQSITLETLAPFPFQHYSSLSFDYQKEILDAWEPCYLKVDGQLSNEEFKSMKSSGIMYYRFKDRKITFIDEFFDIFQYTKSMIDLFKDQLGTYNATTWIIHNDTKTSDERKAMKAILLQASNEREGLDLSFTVELVPYLKFLKSITTNQKSKFHNNNITYGRYGSNKISQDDIDAIDLDLDTWFYAFKHISVYPASWLKHPMITQDFYDDLKLNHPTYFNELLKYLVEGYSDKYALVDRIDMDKVFKDSLPIYTEDWHHKIDEWFLDDETDPEHPLAGVKTLEELFAMEYPLEHVVYDPYEYYCCEEHDGPLPDNWEDDIKEYDVDRRMEFILTIIKPWDKYITNHGRAAMPFISDDRFKEVVEGLKDFSID